MSLLEVKNLTFEYGTGKFRNLALNDVSFSLEKGEILSIIGHTAEFVAEHPDCAAERAES